MSGMGKFDRAELDQWIRWETDNRGELPVRPGNHAARALAPLLLVLDAAVELVGTDDDDFWDAYRKLEGTVRACIDAGRGKE